MGSLDSTPKPERTEGAFGGPEGFRGCLKCKDRLPLFAFPATGDNTHSWVCKNCDGIRRMFSSAKYRARRDGLQFNITVVDIRVPKVCPILGIPIGFDLPSTATSPSLDRIQNHLGYVRGNVQVISTRANTLKGDSTLADLICLGEWAIHTAIQHSTTNPVGVK